MAGIADYLKCRLICTVTTFFTTWSEEQYSLGSDLTNYQTQSQTGTYARGYYTMESVYWSHRGKMLQIYTGNEDKIIQNKIRQGQNIIKKQYRMHLSHT